MADLEKFLHGEPVAMPVLIRAALAHAQFETIHPFRDTYYERLQAIGLRAIGRAGSVFLEGVISVSNFASETTKRIVELIERDRKRISALGRAAGSALLVFNYAIREVVLRIPETAEQLPVSEPTVATAVGQLERIDILRELTGRPRNKIFAYDEYLKILSEGTEPLWHLTDGQRSESPSNQPAEGESTHE